MKETKRAFSPFAFFLCVLIVSQLVLGSAIFASAEAKTPQAPSGIGAQAYCLMDCLDGKVLLQKNAELSLPIASTTKIMTAVIILENCDRNDIVSVSPLAAGTEGSSVYLQAGEKISVNDLLYALMLESANDAAMALALYCSESIEEFAALMNAKAKELGMVNTTFQNPSGLSCDTHQASAKDMAILAAYAMQNPTFRQITATKNIRIPMNGGEDYRYLSNHNRLLNKYPYCIGGKTGYTVAAGRCLVSVSEKDGVELVAVTLNDKNDWNDHIALFDYGFSLYQSFVLCDKGQLEYFVPVVGGVTSAVRVSNRDEVVMSLRDREGIEVSWELPFFLYAPVTTFEEGTPGVPLPLGRVVFIKSGVVLAECWLYADESVADYTPPTWWEKILMFFGWKE